MPSRVSGTQSGVITPGGHKTLPSAMVVIGIGGEARRAQILRGGAVVEAGGGEAIGFVGHA